MKKKKKVKGVQTDGGHIGRHYTSRASFVCCSRQFDIHGFEKPGKTVTRTCPLCGKKYKVRTVAANAQYTIMR